MMQFSMAEIKIYSKMRFLLSNSRGLVKSASVALSQIVASSPKFIIEGLGSIAIVTYMLFFSSLTASKRQLPILYISFYTLQTFTSGSESLFCH